MITRIVNNWLKYAQLKHHCTLCLAPSGALALCAACHHDLPTIGTHCERCSLPLPHTSICGECLQKPPSFDQCLALFVYHAPIDQLIAEFKYQSNLASGKLLTTLFAKHFTKHAQSLSHKPDLLIPMPLHDARLKARGFNQATRLATPLSKALDIPIAMNLCDRVRATHHQSALNAKQRKRNLRGAFVCNTPLHNQSVVIIEDVVTTCASVNELATTLRKAGAAHVDVWCLARTPSHLHPS